MPEYTEQELFSILEYSARSLGVPEKEVFEFTRCVRPDGSAYGSRGKCKKGVEQDKPGDQVEEGEGYYKPGKVTGGGSVNLDTSLMAYGPFDVESAREDYEDTKKHLPGLLKHLNKKDLTPEEKDRRRKILKNELVSTRLALRQAENNQKFLSELKKKVPKGVELRVTGHSGIVMLSKTKEGNIVTVTHSPQDGFNFKVNGDYASGTVKDRREQVKIAYTVKSCWDSLVQCLPEGTIVKTSAWDGDGRGEARERAYMRVGFSKGDERDGYMYSQKTRGTMRPVADREAYLAQKKDPESIYFAEDTDSREDVKTWLQILTGEDLL